MRSSDIYTVQFHIDAGRREYIQHLHRHSCKADEVTACYLMNDDLVSKTRTRSSLTLRHYALARVRVPESCCDANLKLSHITCRCPTMVVPYPRAPNILFMASTGFGSPLDTVAIMSLMLTSILYGKCNSRVCLFQAHQTSTLQCSGFSVLMFMGTIWTFTYIQRIQDVNRPIAAVAILMFLLSTVVSFSLLASDTVC